MAFEFTNADMRAIAQRLEKYYPGSIEDAATYDLAGARKRSISSDIFSHALTTVAVGRLLWAVLPTAEQIIQSLQSAGKDNEYVIVHLVERLRKDYGAEAGAMKAKWDLVINELERYVRARLDR